MRRIVCILLYLLLPSAAAIIASQPSDQNQHTASEYIDLNEVDDPIALLVLFNGGAGIAEQIRAETAIPDTAARHRIKTIGIDHSEFYLTDEDYDRIAATIQQVMHEDTVTGGLFMGGFSLGGTTCIRFAEMAVKKGDHALVPKAIFGVDPPLDHLEMYRYAQREISRECSNPAASQIGKTEAKWMLGYYHTNFGQPVSDSSYYIENSCFSVTAPNGGNAIYLRNVPVNMYHEIDIMWLVEERCRDLSDANVMVSSKFINLLYQQGNTEARLTLTQDKGYRADGRRHPHSWSIADPGHTLEWLMRFL